MVIVMVVLYSPLVCSERLASIGTCADRLVSDGTSYLLESYFVIITTYYAIHINNS